jgi:two-component system C4-dicarboxylate transport response regulator DctD
VSGRVLLVEDDDQMRTATMQALELAGMAVTAFSGAAMALTKIDADFDGIVVSDIRMPRMDGLQLLAAVRAIDPDLPIILITGHGDVPMAVAALRDGASDFLTKPFAVDHLVAAIRRELARRAIVIENRRLRAAATESEARSPLIGTSKAIEAVRRRIAQLARADVDVLIEGEPGTGKDLAALTIHRQSSRRARPYLTIDCAALSEGQAEIELFGHAADSVAHTRLSRRGQVVEAQGGTLLLDGIDALPPPIQLKLLRLLEDREVQPIGASRAEAVNVRVIALATNPAQSVQNGSLRAELYHRLAATRLMLPPLRFRDDDRLVLFAYFLDEARREIDGVRRGIADAERREVLINDWPGNVRELRAFAYACALNDHKAEAGEGHDLRRRVAAFEASAISDALAATGGNVTRALDLLGVPRKTLYEKIQRYGLNVDEYRDR